MNGNTFGYRINKVDNDDTHPYRVTRFIALATGEGIDVVIGYRATLVSAAELILEDARMHERGDQVEAKLIREAKDLLEQGLIGKRNGRNLTDQERYEAQLQAWRLLTRALGEEPA